MRKHTSTKEEKEVIKLKFFKLLLIIYLSELFYELFIYRNYLLIRKLSEYRDRIFLRFI